MKLWQCLWQIIRYQPVLYILMALLWGTYDVIALIPGYLGLLIFNDLASHAQAGLGIWGFVALLTGVELARLVMTYGAVAVQVTFRYTIGALLRKNLLERVLLLPGADALNEATGQALTRFRDDVHELMLFSTMLTESVGEVIFAIVAIIIMVRINALITLVVFLPLVGVVIGANAANTSIQKYRRKSLAATGSITGFLGELFGMIQALKVADASSHVMKRFQRMNDTRRQATVKDRTFSELLNSSFMNSVNLSTGLILLLAGQGMQAGTFTVGDLALFVYYLWFVTKVPLSVGGFLADFKQAEVSLERLAELLRGGDVLSLVKHGPVYMSGDAPVPPPTPKTSADRLLKLEADNLTYHYPGSSQGIEGVHLRLERGTCTVITGRVGSGKTTLLRVLLGLLPKEEGEICWNGQVVVDPATFFIPPRSAYTGQVPQLFSETLKENILLGLPESQVDIPTALHLAVLEQDLPDLEHGLETLVGPRGTKLSGGQIQRTALARLFVRDAELLVFDDVSSALDLPTESLFWQQLLANKERTCLVVTQRKAVLSHADHILLLKDGKVEAEGTLPMLLKTQEEMQRLWKN